MAAVAALLYGCLWLLGRPSTMNHGAVSREASSITSTIREAQLLAQIVADGHGLDRATRVHASELATSLDDSATLLSSSQLPHEMDRPADALVTIAGDASDQLERLAADAGDHDTARTVRDALHDDVDRADSVAKRLGA